MIGACGAAAIAEEPTYHGHMVETALGHSLLADALNDDDDGEVDFSFELARDEEDLGIFEGVTFDLGVERMGEISRALQTEGPLREIAGDGLSAQQFAIDGISGPVRLYQADLEWAATQEGPVRFSLLGGVRAFGLSQRWSGVPGATISLDDSASDEIIPVGVLGGSMSVSLTDYWRISGRATGQPVADGTNSFLDVAAESTWAITPELDFTAGYKFMDAVVSGVDTDARLRSDGVYAQIKLRF